MKTRRYRRFVGDFETTVYEGQECTQVWASACVELYSDEVHIFHSIGEQLDYFKSLNSNIICYYHNLKFDGSFWLAYFIEELGLKQATERAGDKIKFQTAKYMKHNTFSYSVSSMGQWYRIILKYKKYVIEFRDSLKLLPFSVETIGKSFETKHRKLEMEYSGYRYAGCEITEEERLYIANDVLVMKEAMELMESEGHTRLTIGSCALAEYKELLGKGKYSRLFPNIYEIKSKVPGGGSAGDYISKSYHGGWCYLVKGKENIEYTGGFTADVNSLYPSMMHSESGNIYPTGEPTFWRGATIPKEALKSDSYYFIRLRTRFYIKPGKLPFIQIKNSVHYRATEMLETSDWYNPEDGEYYSAYYDADGKLHDTAVELTMTMTDYRLFREHYDLEDLEILDGCYFKGKIGVFDCYIDKYRSIKENSKGARRTLAKLFLNNLYGKLASSTASNFKVAYLKSDGVVGFYQQDDNSKEPGYIPAGSAITSYARNFTIRAAQANYNGPDKDGFIYADTDSIHCSSDIKEVKGIRVHESKFCCWKIECEWDRAVFVRAKTYMERVVRDNGKTLEHAEYEIKCAGMPERCKRLIKCALGVCGAESIRGRLTSEEEEFISHRMSMKDFRIGIKVPGKLMPKRIRGGIILKDTTYEMR